MRVAVIGAGVTGLVAAHRLAEEGHEPWVYERWPGLGGQVATLDLGDGCLVERYYHHLFTSDGQIAALYEELGMGDAIEWLPSSVAIFADGRSRPFTTPVDLLRFRPLPLASRLRTGIAALAAQRGRGELSDFERLTAREWVERSMGRPAWRCVWEPLMRGKFGDRADEVSAAWLWSKLRVRRASEGGSARREVLGYPRGGWQPLLEALRDRIERAGGRVMIDRPATAIARAGHGFAITPAAPDSFRRGHDPRRFESGGEPERFDAVLATVPSDIFEQLLVPELRDQIGVPYLERLRSVEYRAALCLLLELDRRFSPFYWTNVADRELPFVGLIEQTNLIPPERYGGRRLLYVANYLARDDPLLELSAAEVLERYTPGLRQVNPGFERRWVKRLWAFHEPAAQPVVTVGYPERIPALETGVPGLMLTNTTQIYPEDRGTNYSVALGGVAARVLSGAS